MRTILLCFLLTAAFVPASFGQVADDILSRIDHAYRQLEYAEAESLATNALGRYDAFTIEEVADLHVYVALIAYSQGDLERARSHFLAAIQLRPNLELDPVLVPPKIQDFVEDLRQDVLSGAVSGSLHAVSPAARYVLVRDPRVDAALRSALVPGWGQLHKGHMGKGVAFAGIFATSVTATVLAHGRRVDARRQYDEAPNRRAADEHYDAYADWGRTRNVFVATSVLVWSASYLDALLTQPQQIPSGSFSFDAAPRQLSLRLHF